MHIVGLSFHSFLTFPEISAYAQDLIRNAFPEALIGHAAHGESQQRHMRLYDKEPYILSRILSNPKNPLKPWAEDQLSQMQEALDNYFDYDTNWRDKIRR